MHPSTCCAIIMICITLWFPAYGDIIWNGTPASVNCIGNANCTPEKIRLTQRSGQVGAVWWTQKQAISGGFNATIEFEVESINNPLECFAFVVQGRSLDARASETKYWGFDFQNNFAIRIGANTTTLFTQNPSSINSGSTSGQQMINSVTRDGGKRTVFIQYRPSSDIIYTAMGSRSGDEEFDLREHLSMQSGTAWVGFTGASGTGGDRIQFKQINITRFEFYSTSPINPCSSVNCSPNQICTLSPDKSLGNCTLKPNRCEVDNPCSGNATCTPVGLAEANCACKPGFEGDGITCTAKPNPCDLGNYCSANATCTPVGFGGANCTCKLGFEGNGTICEERLVPHLCDAKVCSENATCVLEGPEIGTCECNPGFSGNGTICTDLCELAACGNNSHCVVNGSEYACGCGLGFTLHDNSCIEITYTINISLQAIEYHDSFVSISLSWIVTPPLPHPEHSYVLKYGVDLNATKSFITQDANYTLNTDLIPRKYLFSVASFEYKLAENFLQVETLGCLDGICSSTIGEDCLTCPGDCCEETSVSCVDNCNGNGDCNKGNCECRSPFAGPTCSSVTKQIQPDINSKTSNIRVVVGDSNSSFVIRFHSISEIDPILPDPVLSFSLLFPPSSVAGIGETSFSSLFRLPNDALLNISHTTYFTAKIIDFAQQRISIPPNTLKQTIYIENWNFVHIRNYLRIEFEVCVFDFSRNSNCESDAVSPTHWEKYIGQDKLYIKYARNGLIDNKPAQVSTLYNKTNHISTLVIPHFFLNALLDPDFSVLATPNPKGKGLPKNSLKTPVLVGLIVGCVAGTIAIAVLLYFVVTRVQLQRMKWRIQRNSYQDSNASL